MVSPNFMVLSPISIPGNNYNDIQSRGIEFYKNIFSLGKKNEKMNKLRGEGDRCATFCNQTRNSALQRVTALKCGWYGMAIATMENSIEKKWQLKCCNFFWRVLE